MTADLWEEQCRNTTAVRLSDKDDTKVDLKTNSTSHIAALITDLLDLTELSRGSRTIRTKSRTERLSECGLDSVEESHGVRDAVEGQNTCSVIQVHSYSGGQRA